MTSVISLNPMQYRRELFTFFNGSATADAAPDTAAEWIFVSRFLFYLDVLLPGATGTAAEREP